MTRAATLALLLVGCAHAPPAAPSPPAPADADRGAAPTKKFKNVRSREFQAELVEHRMPHLPDEIKIKHVNQELVFLAKLCTGADGHVVSVSVLQSIPDADSAIVELRGWRIRPQPSGQGLCTLVKFEFTLTARFR